MRVGLDYRPALVNREGIGRYARELVRGLVELGFGRNLGLFGYTFAGARYSRSELGLDGSGAELVRLRLPASWTPALLRRLGKGVDDLVGGCELYHHTQYRRLEVRAASEVATLFDCIYSIEGSGYLDPAEAAAMTERARELVRRARLVLVPSEFVAAEVVMTFGVPPARVAVTPLGCDHAVRGLPLTVPPAASPYVLTVTRVDARKNHLRMLSAFERLVREGFPHRWIVAGPPGYGSEVFERALAESPARARVERRPSVTDAELPLLYAQADLFLFASLSEGFGLPPLEAMACGAPVVASGITSLPEVLGDAALYVEPSDVDAIFEGCRQVLREKELARDLARRGKVRARSFPWRETARRTLAAYQAALQPDEGPPVRRAL